MDLLALAERARSRYRDNTGVYSEEEWKAYVNDAYAAVTAARVDWPFMENQTSSTVLTPGTSTATLPAGVWKVSAVYNETDQIPLRQIDGRSAYHDAFDSDDVGIPEHYILRGNTLVVFPTPDASTTLTLDVTLSPADLEDADEPVFAPQHHRVLVSGALFFAYQDQGNLNAASLHQAAFEAGIQRLAEDLFSTRTDSNPGIVDNFF